MLSGDELPASRGMLNCCMCRHLSITIVCIGNGIAEWCRRMEHAFCICRGGGGEPMTDRVAHIVSGGVRKAALKQVRAHAVG